MDGHERRNRSRRLEPLIAVFAIVAAAISGATRLPAEESSQAPERLPQRVDRRVELHWQSNRPLRIQGSVSWAERLGPETGGERHADAESPTDSAGFGLPDSEPPKIHDPINLTPGPLLTGGVFLGDGCELVFGPPPRLVMLPAGEGQLVPPTGDSGGIGFRINALTSDVLVVRFDDQHGAGTSFEISVDELISGPAPAFDFGEEANVTVRCATDELRVRFGEGITLFTPGESTAARLVGDVTLPGDEGDWVIECVTLTADGSTVQTIAWPLVSHSGRFVLPDAAWTAPTAEGAYRVRMRMRPKGGRGISNLTSSGGAGQSFAESLAAPLSHVPDIRSSFAGTHLPWFGKSERRYPQSEFWIAVVGDEPAETAAATDQNTASQSQEKWKSVGKAEPRDSGRRLTGQGGEWLAGGAIGSLQAKLPAGEVKRTAVLAAGARQEFSVPIAQPGERHRAVIRLPVGSPVRLAAELFDSESGDAVPLGPGLVIHRTDLPGESGFHTAEIDFYPRSLKTRLVLTNQLSDSEAVFEPIEIQHAATPASAAPSPADAGGRLAAMRLELGELFELFGASGAVTADRPLDYHTVWTATNRLITTLRREGYGGVILTVSSDGAACYPQTGTQPSAAWDANRLTDAGAVDALELIMRMFDRESLALVPCIRFSEPVAALEAAYREGNAWIAGPSPLGGRLGKWSFDSPPVTAFGIYNPLDPTVADHVVQVMSDLSRRCSGHRSVTTLGLLVDERTYLRLPPITPPDAATLDAFHADLGASAPSRTHLAGWTQAAGAETYERWRKSRADQIIHRTLDAVEGKSLLLLALDAPLPSRLVELGRDPRVLTTRLYRRSSIEPPAMRIRDEACSASVPIAAEQTQPILAHDMGLFHQPVSVSNAEFETNAWSREKTVSSGTGERLTPLLAAVESSLVPAQLLSRSDRTILAIGGGAIDQPGSEVRRQSLDVFSHLPPTVMVDVRGGDAAPADIRVRQGSHGGYRFIYAVNPTRRNTEVTVVLDRPAAVSRLGGNVEVSARSGPSNRWTVMLRPGELAAVRIEDQAVGAVSYTSACGNDETYLASLRGFIHEAVGALPLLIQPGQSLVVRNADFEEDAADSVVPGWLTAQFPPGCVAVDRKVAFSGKQSIRLSGDSERTGGSWIVSPVIEPPPSGRLAVSLRLRTQSADPGESAAPVVRLALEGTVAGTPIRKTRSIQVPRTGQWSNPPERLEVTLPSLPVESLRLTIDLMSEGVVWVDDIAFYDSFVTAGEKTQLEHLLFLAAGGASRDDWSGVSRLLDSHWVHEINRARNIYRRERVEQPDGIAPPLIAGGARDGGSETMVRPVNGWKAAAPTPSPAGKKTTASDEGLRRGIVERLKSWLPRPPRF